MGTGEEAYLAMVVVAAVTFIAILFWASWGD